MAESCLTHVYAYAGKLHEAMEAGERALPIFESRGNVWWACRTLWGLSLTAIPLGEWKRSLQYCHRAVEHGEAVGDQRLRIVGWWRTGWTHIQRGEVEMGVHCCEEATALSPAPFDAAMIKAARGYGLVKLGEIEAGITALAEAVQWFESSHLPFTQAWYALWLADSYVRAGDRVRARQLAEQVLAKSQETEYRYFEGMAERLLGASLLLDDPGAAAHHLDTAEQILEEVGARNEVAKTLVDLAEIRRRGGDPAEARRLLERALATFEELGTLDEPIRVRAALERLR
jgi:tetratricopeptide (TPR) repeat protein